AARIEAERAAGLGLLFPPLEPAPRSGEPLPLSFAQQRLWFLDQLEPGSPAYNIPAAVRFEGPLDLGLLRAAFGEIVRRHEVLRTTFAVVGGQPRQVVHAAPEAVSILPEIDLRALPAPIGAAWVAALTRQEILRPFDLERGPLWRGLVLHAGEGEHVAVLSFHHAVTDGWSSSVLVRELVALYTAFSTRQASPLPLLPVQYADFAAWQRRCFSGEILERELAYWKAQLAGLPPILELPT